MNRRLVSAGGVLVLTAASTAFAMAPATAAGNVMDRPCDSASWISVTLDAGPWYSAIGPAAGKYNGSKYTSTLSLALSANTTRSSTLVAGASMTLSWGIAQIEGNTDYSVTKETSKSWTATDTISVPGHWYGYARPKVEYRRFNVSLVQQDAKCNVHVKEDYGDVDAITTYPFFSECTATGPCTPKP